MRCRPSLFSRQRGAALLLLMALGGLGAALLLMSAFQPGSGERANEQQTYKRLAEAREALIGYAAQHGRLPRPATSALDGRERPQQCDSGASCTGFIPWVTLGIEGADSWGKMLRYSVTPAFTVIPIQAMFVGGDKIIVTRDNKGQPFYRVGREGCALFVQCPPAVIFSSGKSNPGVSVYGTALLNPSSTNLDERQNDTATNKFMSRARNTDPALPGGEFDDLVTFVPTQLLYARMRRAQVLK
ncbi:hypothetical protein [Duganella radicis]|uniref:Type II secretion system protein n=1 Tax=Duganella radicis TaxID=551988 RepID=A0A6L6PP59_9BURK|nr:hypothetical protein [Duganella radicis]MTV40529.1 hypothetical protein [Duganella radicis]